MSDTPKHTTPESDAGDARSSAKRRAAAMRRASDVWEQLADELPALEVACGAGDPLVTFVRSALEAGRPAILEAACAAVAARLIAELTGRPGVERVAEIAGTYGLDVGEGFNPPRILFRLRLRDLDGAEGFATAEWMPGAAALIRAASLLSELLADSGAGLEADGGDVWQAERTQGPTLLFEIPARWTWQEAWLHAGEVRCLGLGGFEHLDAATFAGAKLKLRTLNAGRAEGPLFVEADNFAACQLPGAREALAALRHVRDVFGCDTSAAFLVVERGRVVGVGGWGEPRPVDQERDDVDDQDAGEDPPATSGRAASFRPLPVSLN